MFPFIIARLKFIHQHLNREWFFFCLLRHLCSVGFIELLEEEKINEIGML